MPTRMPGWDNVHDLVEIVISLIEIGNFGSLRKNKISKVAFEILPTIPHCRISELGSLLISHVQVRLVKNRSSPFLKTTIMKSTHCRRHREFDTWKYMRIVPIHHQQLPPGKFQRIRSQVWSDLINWSRDSRWITKARAVDSSDDVSWTTMSKDNAFHSSVSWCGHRNSHLGQ